MLQSSKRGQEKGDDVPCCQVAGCNRNELRCGLERVWNIERDDACTALASSHYAVAGVGRGDGDRDDEF